MNEAALTKEERAAIKKIQLLLDDPTGPGIFDKKEIGVIREMIATYESFRAFGRLAHFVRQIVIWAAVMIGAYYAVTEWVVKGIRKVSGE